LERPLEEEEDTRAGQVAVPEGGVMRNQQIAKTETVARDAQHESRMPYIKYEDVAWRKGQSDGPQNKPNGSLRGQEQRKRNAGSGDH